MNRRRLTGGLCAVLLAAGAMMIAADANTRAEETAAPAAPAANSVPQKQPLRQALAELKVPPAWFATTNIAWDTSKPWKDARLEIRRLLALNTEPEKIRQAVKLAWLYMQKNEIGEGGEWPMYLFMAGEYAWAAQEYPKLLRASQGKGAVHAYLCYASILSHFGEYEQAMGVLSNAARDLPKPPWKIRGEANIHEHRGDLLVRMGRTNEARAAYDNAIRLLPTSDQPYGKHLLPRHVERIKTKVEMLSMKALEEGKLKDGRYVGRAMGYADKEMVITVTIGGGRIADVDVKHEEKIDLGATRIIPQRIVEANSLKVDAITGATVTSQGIIEGAFKALKQAESK